MNLYQLNIVYTSNRCFAAAFRWRHNSFSIWLRIEREADADAEKLRVWRWDVITSHIEFDLRVLAWFYFILCEQRKNKDIQFHKAYEKLICGHISFFCTYCFGGGFLRLLGWWMVAFFTAMAVEREIVSIFDDGLNGRIIMYFT